MTTAVPPIPVRNPRTGEYDHEIQPPTTEELDALCAGVRAAQPRWESAGVKHRADVLRRWAEVEEWLIEAARVHHPTSSFTELYRSAPVNLVFRMQVLAQPEFREAGAH